jgi:DNA-binding response OmpR family regulator
MLHVLLVEDNSADVLVIREAIRTSLAEADVVIACDGEQALRILIEFRFKPDVIFLDLNVPKVDGFQVLERSRADKGSPVIVLTSSSNPADNRRAFELGAREYIVKPFDLDCFLNAVRKALERWTSNARRRSM